MIDFQYFLKYYLVLLKVLLYCTQITITKMENLLNTLSLKLQTKLADFGTKQVFIDFNEVNTVSNYELDYSFIEAIEKELIALGHQINN